MKTSFVDYFLYLIAKNVRLTGSQNVLNFGLKSSKSRLRPRPHWGGYDAPSDPLVVRGLLPSQSLLRAFGAQSLLAPPNKNSRPVSPRYTKSYYPDVLLPRHLHVGNVSSFLCFFFLFLFFTHNY